MEERLGSEKTIKKQRIIAIGESLLVTVIWSSTFVIVKFGLETLGPLTIAGLRYFLGALVLVPFLLIRGSLKITITKKLWMQLFLIGISAYTIGNGALFWGLKYVPATTGSFLMSLIPLLVLGGGALLLKEIPTRWQVFGVFLSLFGSILFFSSGLQKGEPRGMAIVSMGLIGFMAFSLLGRGIARERKLDTLTLTTLPLAIGGLLSIMLALVVEGVPQFSSKSILIVLWLAVVNTSLGYLMYNHSLRELTALEMNMIMNLSPLFTALLSWIALGETLGFIQIAGMTVMIVGVVFVQLFTDPKRPNT
ncbi:MAG: EamA family transporter [Anaerolineales bacterium]|nr:EamA family transporter [Anaerolineales bacterium]